MTSTFLGISAEGWTLTLVGALIGALVTWAFRYLPDRRAPGGLSQLTADVGGVGAPAIAELAEGLEFLFDGHPVPRVTVTAIGIWNSGRQAVRRDQLSPRSPLRVEINEGGQLLQATILAASADHIGASIIADADRGVALIDFDALNEGEGMVVQMIHTAGASNAQLCGHVIDQGSIIAFEHPAQRALRRSFPTALLVTLGMFGFIIGSARISRVLSLPPLWAEYLAAGPTVLFVAWAVFGSGPSRSIKRLPAVIRNAPGLLSAGWPTLP